MAIYKTRDKQSIWDLAVQLYGDVSKIGNLLKLFPNLDSELTLNSEINIETQTDPIAVFFKDQGIIVSTDIPDTPAPIGFTVDSALTTVDSDLITADKVTV